MAVARNASVDEMARFAVAFAVYLLVAGVTKAMVAEPLSAALPDSRGVRAGGGVNASWSLLFGGLSTGAGLLVGSPYIVLVGLTAHGVCLGEFSKSVSTAFLNPWTAVRQEAGRLLLFLAMLLASGSGRDPVLTFGAWLVAGAVAGYAGALAQRLALRPARRHPLIPTRMSLSYAADHLLGAGTTQLGTFGIAVWASPSTNAGMRGVGTILGPVATLVAASRPLIIPFLSRGRRRGVAAGSTRHLVLAMVLMAVPMLVVVNWIPDTLGEAVLGDTWGVAKPLLPIMSVEAVLAMLSAIAFAGHRSLAAHGRTLRIRCAVSPVRLLFIVGGGAWAGPLGAAWGTLIATVTSSAVWWMSYSNLMKKED
ncbi:hypothetical protein ACH0BW_01230 [Micrococcus luteus]|uniref:hypothetical protein n=1 Tax=Micrococcus luteus TaxID=1270 RepID=UPI003879E654